MDSPGNSKIRNIQRISRSNRLNKTDPHKKSRVFVWADEYDEIVTMIKHLKEFDDDFKSEKAKIINSNFDKRNVVKPRTTKDKSYEELDNLIVGIKKVIRWEEILKLVENYVQIHDKLPIQSDEDVEVRSLNSWISNQKIHYKNKSYIMKHKTMQEKWEIFTQAYPHLFISFEQAWVNTLKMVENYIKTNNKLPPILSNDEQIGQMGRWIFRPKTKL